MNKSAELVAEARQEVIQLLGETGALLRGNYSLAYGQKSKYYFDGRLFTMDPRGRVVTGLLVWDIVKRWNPVAIGGLETGAIPIIDSVAMTAAREGVDLHSFYVRKQVKDHGTKRRIEGISPAVTKGDVVIVDDTITTGKSILDACKAAEDEGWHVVAIVALLERHERGGAKNIASAYEFRSVLETDENGEVSFSDQKESGAIPLPVTG